MLPAQTAPGAGQKAPRSDQKEGLPLTCEADQRQIGNKRSLGSLNRYGGELIRLVELDRGPRRVTSHSDLARRCEHFPDSYGDEVHEKVACAASILVFVIRWGDLAITKDVFPSSIVLLCARLWLS